MDNYLLVSTPRGPMNVFVAAENGTWSLPVVIVLQEAFGVNNHIKDICRRLAAEGYLALAPELYHREGRHLVADYSDRASFKPLMGKLTNDGLIEDIDSLLKFIPLHPRADISQVFTLGFCMGGFTSLLAATRFDLQGAISFYGAGVIHEREGIKLSPFIDEVKNVKCPTLLFYGADDASIPADDITRIERELTNSKRRHEVHIFPGADHGFFCNERKSFDPSSTSKAWKRVLSWLEERKSEDYSGDQFKEKFLRRSDQGDEGQLS